MQNNRLNILVVDDMEVHRFNLGRLLKDHNVLESANFKLGSHLIATKSIDLCFLDLSLNTESEKLEGLELVSQAAKKKIYTVVMSSHEDENTVKKAYSLGANDFYPKGNENKNVLDILAQYILTQNNSLITRLLEQNYFTKDPETIKDLRSLAHINSLNKPILLSGPNGIGKSSLAKCLYQISNLKGGFHTLDCSGLSDNSLAESTLFGHKKGAFTGATADRKGIFEFSHNGTLFIDEIGVLSLKLQEKFLRFLQTGEYVPVGANQAIKSDVRVIAGTNENLADLVTQGKFREDLYYRICGFHIKLKPLRERKCDIWPLIERYSVGRKKVFYTDDAKELILNNPWHGNIRELINFTEYLTTIIGGEVTKSVVNSYFKNSIVSKFESSIHTQGQYDYAVENGLPNLVDKIRKEIIQKNLLANDNKKSVTKEVLQVSNNTMYPPKKREGLNV